MAKTQKVENDLEGEKHGKAVEMLTHLDILLTFLEIWAIITTLVLMKKAKPKERIKFITPLIWFTSDLILGVYCVHCPMRGTHVRQPWKNIWSGANKIVGMISFFSALYIGDNSNVEDVEKIIQGAKSQ